MKELCLSRSSCASRIWNAGRICVLVACINGIARGNDRHDVFSNAFPSIIQQEGWHRKIGQKIASDCHQLHRHSVAFVEPGRRLWALMPFTRFNEHSVRPSCDDETLVSCSCSGSKSWVGNSWSCKVLPMNHDLVFVHSSSILEEHSRFNGVYT